nr:YibE/F family protein [uncultured Bacillus sp.]
MNVLVLLGIILFILMTVIGGNKGARSFLAIFFNFSVILITVLLMANPNFNPFILTLIAGALISLINLFYINEVNSTTKTAFLSTLITIVLLLFFIVIVAKKTLIQGFGEEEVEELSIFSLYIGVDFAKIGVSVIIMSTIGAITDTAMAISSPMREIYYHNPSISKKDLYLSGINIGKDILGTSTNTLVFAFFGSYLGLLIWFKDLSYSMGEIINSKVFSAEMITILCSGIGVALIIPITAWITAHFLVKTTK